MLSDVWPSSAEVAAVVASAVAPSQFTERYAAVDRGPRRVARAAGADRRDVRVGRRLDLHPQAVVLRRPAADPGAAGRRRGRALLAILGDSVTTDHISPAGNIAKNSPAAKYLAAHGVAPADYNQYGARRGNHEVMVRGTFANIRLKNLMVPGVEGGVTVHQPSGEQLRSTTRRCATPTSGSRWWSWPASSTAPAARATGRPRARCCSACGS
jgi:aconitate hydratase